VLTGYIIEINRLRRVICICDVCMGHNPRLVITIILERFITSESIASQSFYCICLQKLSMSQCKLHTYGFIAKVNH